MEYDYISVTTASSALTVIPRSSESVPEVEFTIVIPFQNSKDPLRIKNLMTCLEHYQVLQKIQILVVEQFNDDNPPVVQSNGTFEVLPLKINGKFAKSTLINNGIMRATNERVIVCDADILINLKDILNSIIYLDVYDFVKPFCLNLRNLTTVAESSKDAWSLPSTDRSCTPLGGGAFALHRSFFFDLGGFDEKFCGWGHEDVVFTLKVMQGGKFAAYDGAALHLYHTRESENKDNLDYFNNIKKMSKTKFIDYVKQQKSIFNYLYLKND